MYELPELEVIKAIMAEKYAGATITKVICNTKAITGKKSEAVRRAARSNHLVCRAARRASCAAS